MTTEHKGKRRRMVGRKASNIPKSKVNWLWRGIVPYGKIAIFTGVPGAGKSTLGVTLAAAASRGRRLPGDEECGPAEPGNVLIFAAEDDDGDTTIPRLEYAGADMDRVTCYDDEDGDMPVIPIDCDLIEEEIVKHQAKLVIFDTLNDFISGLDVKDNPACRTALDPLKVIARRHGVAIVFTAHPPKGSRAAIDRVSGSNAFTGLARSVYICGKKSGDPDDVWVLARIKCNLYKPIPAQRYRLAAHPDGTSTEWLGNADGVYADDLDHRAEAGEQRKLDEAKAILAQILADSALPSKAVYIEAEAAGLSRATLRRAQDELGIKPRKVGKNNWEWPCATEWSSTGSGRCPQTPEMSTFNSSDGDDKENVKMPNEHLQRASSPRKTVRL
jgi:putative DNA primase/helicase